MDQIADDAEMIVGSQSSDGPTIVTSSKAHPSQRKKVIKPRVPPLFERDVGHVIFRGNEKLGAPEHPTVATDNSTAYQ